MKWEEVNYLCNHLMATVLYDTSKEPLKIYRYRGKIKCLGPGLIPTLHPTFGELVINPPHYAIVILEPPL
jgi:hypothetical protein